LLYKGFFAYLVKAHVFETVIMSDVKV
jgi:hypothetical protein